jgi:SAM-dependent methyltransferase
MADLDETDVPSPIDLRSARDAREWARTAMLKRPWRAEFFARIVEELRRLSRPSLTVLELGSGPGFLAHQILDALPDTRYTAMDFSPTMHDLARERLGLCAERVTFVERDLREADWATRMSAVDAVVTMQAVHELRHKRRAAGLYKGARTLLKPDGVLLTCDHMVGPDGMTNADLFMTLTEHEAAIRAGGFATVDLLVEKGGLALFRAFA